MCLNLRNENSQNDNLEFIIQGELQRVLRQLYNTNFDY